MTAIDFSKTGSFAIGSPKFPDVRLAQLAKSSGSLAAWHEAFSKKGVVAAQNVAGNFAVGLRDDAGRVFLAVDRFAVDTVCYRVTASQIAFSTRADDLATVDTPIDPQAIFDYLFFHAIPSPRTIFKGVFRLPPGHCALFENGQLTVSAYWVPEFVESKTANFESLKTEFRDLLRNSVADELDGGKAACFLSGGTDSSTVAGMIGEAGKTPAATYSIGFDAAGYDEMEFARLAAKRFNTEHHEYYVTPDDLVRSVAKVAAHYDQPFGNSSALPAYYCAQMAKDDGVTKILAGDGGDELFGGNSRYAKQRIFGWYGVLPGAVRRGLMEPLMELPVMGKIPLISKGASYVEQAKVPMPDRLNMYNLLLRLGVGEVLTTGFLEQVDIDSPAHQQRAVWAQAKTTHTLNRTLAFDWRYTLAESDLPKVCGTTRLAGIGVGFPMLSAQLLDFSLKLPTNYKLKGFKLRWFFKEALRGFLPDEILAKKKQGFGLPFGVWATRHPELKKLAVDSLYSLSQRGIVRADFIETLVKQRLPEHPGYYGEMVWILMMLEQWLQAKAPAFKLA
jgi:asparagine synthase (glutamine-hydrolysing)